jgi:hypothetical protein
LLLDNNCRTSHHNPFIDVKLLIFNIPNLLRNEFGHILSDFIVCEVKLLPHNVLAVHYKEYLVLIELALRHVACSMCLLDDLALLIILSLNSVHGSFVHDLRCVQGLIELCILILLLL